MISAKQKLISPESPSYKWWLGTALVIGQTSVGFAERMVEIAIPQIMIALRVNLDKAQWVRTGPAIVRTMLGPMVGWLAGIFGIREIYIATFIIYIISSGFAGAAWSFAALIFFVTLKNAGGGLRQPLSMALLYRAFPSHQRGLAMGLYQASHMVGPLLAPLLGGWLVEEFGWRSVFYINIPINILSLLLIMLVMPKDFETQERKWPASVDFIGLVTMGLCLSTLLWAVNDGKRLGWDSNYIVSLFSVSAVSCVLFLYTELKTRYPIVEIKVFKNVSFTLSFLARLFNTGIFQSTNFIFGIFLQRELRFSPLEAGQRLVPMAFASGIGGVVWGILSDKINMPAAVAASLVASSVTMHLYSKLEVGISHTYIILVTMFQSLFRSGAQATMTTLALGTLPGEKVTLGAGLDNLARNLGNTIGIPLITTYVTHREGAHLTSLMRAQTVGHGTGHGLKALERALEKAGEPPARARMISLSILRNQLVERAAIEAHHAAFRLAAVAGLFLVPLVLFIRTIHDRKGRAKRGFGSKDSASEERNDQDRQR
ncbi:MAG: DHA2 family efflux MFS transporter permease subunit [Deltaproteobacteria bacterium]|nr:DHA2 family efflux MFS transporter permease subunit [Deltaproteobacteria bacterium]